MEPSRYHNRLPLAKMHIIIGVALITLALVFIMLEMSIGYMGLRLDIMYPAYAACIFCMSTGFTGVVLGYQEGYFLLALLVIFLDIINSWLVAIAIMLNLELSHLISFFDFLIIGLVVVVLSWTQFILLITYICPVCAPIRRRLQDIDDELMTSKPVLQIKEEEKEKPNENNSMEVNSGTDSKDGSAAPKSLRNGPTLYLNQADIDKTDVENNTTNTTTNNATNVTEKEEKKTITSKVSKISLLFSDDYEIPVNNSGFRSTGIGAKMIELDERLKE